MKDATKDEVLRQVEIVLAAFLSGSRRSSNGRMGAWATPNMATMEQTDDALKAIRSLRLPRVEAAPTSLP